MRVDVEKYNPEWSTLYKCLQIELEALLIDFKPVIEHIGSTAVPGLASKPVIDILVGVREPGNLDKVPGSLSKHDYVYYQKYNAIMPYRRFFVKLKSRPCNFTIPKMYKETDDIPDGIDPYKLAHVHVIEYESNNWLRHIAFRDYLKNNLNIRQEYEALKLALGKLFWIDNKEYNKAKNEFIKDAEKKALAWYGQRRTY
jgi:GrpB-like predicted nucleotidyltransferase (UPF0157 family)